MGSLPAASVVYLFSLLLTGAFHEDGLADTADALGGAGDREQLFVVLKDSRVGTYGAMALAVTLLLRVALLAESGSLGWLALLASQSLARVPPVWLMVTMRYITVEELSKSERISHAGVWQGVLALAIGAVVLGYLITAQYLGAGGALALASGLTGGSLVLAWLFHRRAGGITGDFLGAAEQVCEVTTLAALVVAWR
jgi:adenosylcobinamide-GDP ribazoletransferase